jgi:hypothetical protein
VYFTLLLIERAKTDTGVLQCVQDDGFEEKRSGPSTLDSLYYDECVVSISIAVDSLVPERSLTG